MQFIKQIILEAAHNTVAHQLTRLYFLLFSGTSIYIPNWITRHAPYCLGAIGAQCSQYNASRCSLEIYSRPYAIFQNAC